MSIKYSDITNAIGDNINDRYFISTHKNETKRAVNRALRDVNNGRVTDNPRGAQKRRVGYDFQRETVDLTYVLGTERYTVSDVITLSQLKYIDNVLIDSDENVKFNQRTAQYFRRRRGVNKSIERMWANEFEGGDRDILIYNAESNTLNLIWYSNFMVLGSDGTTRNETFTGSDDTEEKLLMQDTYSDSVIDIASAYLIKQDRTEVSTGPSNLLIQGRNTLTDLINSHGKREKKPVDGPDINSEWGNYDGNRNR